MAASKVVVVTGCSAGGIGASVCEAFFARGHTVYAASRNVSKMSTLSAGIHRIELDVNSEESIARGVGEILGSLASNGRIDVLVNNAGQGCVAPLMEVEMKRLRDTFEVNVFGLIAMSQACSVPMVKQRDGTRFGINVMCVAPGAIKSQIGASNDKKQSILKPAPQSTPTDVLAATIVDNALATRPPRYLNAGYRSTAAFLSFYLPTFAKEYFWGTQFGTREIGKA
ncbi:hypothetical protein RQP46_005701 [Phenoliferia psychrophenolica]